MYEKEKIDKLKQYVKELEDVNNELRKKLEDNSGTIIVKGLCYEDIITILMRNGYDVWMDASACKDINSATYKINYTPHDYINGCVCEF